MSDFKLIRGDGSTAPTPAGLGEATPAQDRLGRTLSIGDVVMPGTQVAPLFHLAEVQPVLDPGVAPGTLRLIFTSAIQLYIHTGDRRVPVVRVQSVHETAAMLAQQQDGGNGRLPS